MGIAIRDCARKIVIAAMIWNTGTLSICAAEALAVLESLKLARSKDIVISECSSNANSVVQQLNCFAYRLTKERLLVEE